VVWYGEWDVCSWPPLQCEIVLDRLEGSKLGQNKWNKTENVYNKAYEIWKVGTFVEQGDLAFLGQ